MQLHLFNYSIPYLMIFSPKSIKIIIYENSVWHNFIIMRDSVFKRTACHNPENQETENHHTQVLTVINCLQKQHSWTVQSFWYGCYCSICHIALSKKYILRNSINFLFLFVTKEEILWIKFWSFYHSNSAGSLSFLSIYFKWLLEPRSSGGYVTNIL